MARQGVVAASFHVLHGAVSGSVRLIGERESARIAGVLAVDAATDLAVLTVPSLEAPTLPLRDRDVAVGNPLDLEGTFSEGIVSGKRKLDGARLLQITAPISRGSSGGPVLDGQARVVGVATRRCALGRTSTSRSAPTTCHR